jgi:hypothetical protein
MNGIALRQAETYIQEWYENCLKSTYGATHVSAANAKCRMNKKYGKTRLIINFMENVAIHFIIDQRNMKEFFTYLDSKCTFTKLAIKIKQFLDIDIGTDDGKAKLRKQFNEGRLIIDNDRFYHLIKVDL